MKLELWDTAGQEAFHSLNSTYFRQADAAIFVYDIGRKETTDEVKYWANELDEKEDKLAIEDGSQMITGLVGNKIDLPEDQI